MSCCDYGWGPDNVICHFGEHLPPTNLHSYGYVLQCGTVEGLLHYPNAALGAPIKVYPRSSGLNTQCRCECGVGFAERNYPAPYWIQVDGPCASPPHGAECINLFDGPTLDAAGLFAFTPGVAGRCCIQGVDSPQWVSFITTEECCSRAPSFYTVSTRSIWFGNSTESCDDDLDSCCGCDWCCNMPAGACRGLRDQPNDSVPRPGTALCAQQNFNCGVSEISRRPSYESEEFRPGPVYAQGGIPNRVGPHEFTSIRPVRPCDKAPPTAECRTWSLYPRRRTTSVARHNVDACGRYKRNDPASNDPFVVMRKTRGKHSFVMSYRKPCPERPTGCN